jgi:hypothetical protein
VVLKLWGEVVERVVKNIVLELRVEVGRRLKRIEVENGGAVT